MHELSLAEHMIDTALRTDGVTPARLRALHVACGELSGVNTASMEFCLQLACRQRGIEGVTVTLRDIKAELHCRCGRRYEAPGIFCACPECGGTEHTVEGGRDVTLESVEVEDD